MKQFFNAILWLSVLFIGLMLYYTLKFSYVRSRKYRHGKVLFARIYDDEKEYLHNRLKSLLFDLQQGKIRWLLIYSRLFPEDQIELTYSQPDQEVNLIQRNRLLSENERAYLRHLGVNKYCTQTDKIILSTAPNSKIITDLIYFLLENICKQQRARNIRINISGEQDICRR